MAFTKCWAAPVLRLRTAASSSMSSQADDHSANGQQQGSQHQAEARLAGVSPIGQQREHLADKEIDSPTSGFSPRPEMESLCGRRHGGGLVGVLRSNF